MSQWLLYTLITLFLYGLWGFFPKLASNFLDAKSAWVWEALGFALASIVIMILTGVKPVYHPKGVTFAMLTGVAGSLGTLFFFLAISKYKASVVTTITALYPLVTIILSVLILKEAITIKQGLGILTALFSIYLVTS